MPSSGIKPGQRPAAPKLQDRPHVERGDELYFRDSKGSPWSGKVLAHGEHGCTVELSGGERHKVRWDGVLGHRRRAQPSVSIVDQGEDGFVTRDQHSGELRYIHDPLSDEDEGEEPMAKALPLRNPLERMLALRANYESPLEKALRKNAPGLTLKKVTDKNGRQTGRWVKTAKDAPKERRGAKVAAEAPKPASGPPPGHHDAKKGDTVAFEKGEHKGTGKIVSFGEKGAVVIDGAGAQHKIEWDHVRERTPEKPGPKLVVPGKGDEKPPPKPIGEEHDKHFHTEGASMLDPSKLRRQKGPEPDSAAEADRRIRAAGEGKGAKRAPVRVTANEDGSHTIQDGHATTSVGVKHGWKSIPAHVVQPHDTKDEVFKAGAEAVEYLKTWLNKGKGLADQMGFQTMSKPPSKVSAAEFAKPGGMLFIAPIKGDERAEEKVRDDYGGDWSRLKDVARCTLAVDTLDDLRAAEKKLEASGMVVAQPKKDRYAGKATGEGYRDVNMIVRAPNGHLMEVQLNTKAMMEAKNEGHHHYEATRSIVGRNKGVPPEKWSEQDNSAYWHGVDEQKRIYGAAAAKLGLEQ